MQFGSIMCNVSDYYPLQYKFQKLVKIFNFTIVCLKVPSILNFSFDKGSFGSYLNISYRDNDETEMSDIRVKKSFVITNEHASAYIFCILLLLPTQSNFKINQIFPC